MCGVGDILAISNTVVTVCRLDVGKIYAFCAECICEVRLVGSPNKRSFFEQHCCNSDTVCILSGESRIFK